MIYRAIILTHNPWLVVAPFKIKPYLFDPLNEKLFESSQPQKP